MPTIVDLEDREFEAAADRARSSTSSAARSDRVHSSSDRRATTNTRRRRPHRNVRERSSRRSTFRRRRVAARVSLNNNMEVSVMMGVVSNETLTAMERRRLEMSTEYFLVPTPVMSTGGVATSTFPPAVPAVEMTSLFRNEVWVVPALSLSALVMVFIAGFEVFVVCKARRTTPSRRHLFLGQMLLLGLFGCAALGTVLAVQPTPFSCGVVRFGTGVALALVFASLLVKCVFLISLNSGVYLPASYQALLLLFAVLIQVNSHADTLTIYRIKAKYCLWISV